MGNSMRAQAIVLALALQYAAAFNMRMYETGSVDSIFVILA